MEFAIYWKFPLSFFGFLFLFPLYLLQKSIKTKKQKTVFHLRKQSIIIIFRARSIKPLDLIQLGKNPLDLVWCSINIEIHWTGWVIAIRWFGWVIAKM